MVLSVPSHADYAALHIYKYNRLMVTLHCGIFLLIGYNIGKPGAQRYDF